MEALANPVGHRPSRRQVLVIGGTLVGGALLVGCSAGDALSLGGPSPDFGPFGPFVKITPDGWVTVVMKHLEMGQGSNAGLPAIVAEELDADWNKVRVEFAPAMAKVYANTMLRGVQLTGGSTGVPNSWVQLRKAGAAARAMFVEAAAAKWSVPAGEVTVKDGVVSHALGKSARFGELLADAAKVTPPADPKLKDPRNFTLIGTDRVRRKDSRAKSTGAIRYTQDVREPGMLVAVVAHPPRFGATVRSFDDSAALRVPGMVKVLRIPSGVAVVGENTWAAIQGRRALQAAWNDDKAEKRSTGEIFAEYRAIAAGNSKLKAWPFDSHGDAASAFGGELFEATYDFPYLAHAPMEPMNCVARVDGGKVKLTYAAQGHSLDQLNVARVTLSLPGSIEIETLPAGGSFGRRSNRSSDYVVECAHIAKALKGRPVKLVWTREDDMTGGFYRPMAHHAVTVKLGPDGLPSAWRLRVVTQSISKGVIGAAPFDEYTVEGAMGSPYLKASPVVDAMVYMPESPVSVLWWRAVGSTHTAMVMEHTIDQLARKTGKDPVDYRRALYEKAGAKRHLAVLNLAAEKAGWGQPLPEGVARGIAVHESYGTLAAQVAEVSLKDGEPCVRRVVTAIDCGIAVAPDLVAAQMEGGVCFGLSAALFGATTLKDGKVEQTNFDGYRVLRMNEAPQVETYIIPSEAPPSGVGLPGVPAVAPAVANALLALTGKATTSLPFVKT